MQGALRLPSASSAGAREKLLGAQRQLNFSSLSFSPLAELFLGKQGAGELAAAPAACCAGCLLPVHSPRAAEPPHGHPQGSPHQGCPSPRPRCASCASPNPPCPKTRCAVFFFFAVAFWMGLAEKKKYIFFFPIDTLIRLFWGVFQTRPRQRAPASLDASGQAPCLQSLENHAPLPKGKAKCKSLSQTHICSSAARKKW